LVFLLFIYLSRVASRTKRKPQDSTRETRDSNQDHLTRKPQDPTLFRPQIKIDRPSRGAKLGRS
jgi:hypothetical protein